MGFVTEETFDYLGVKRRVGLNPFMYHPNASEHLKYSLPNAPGQMARESSYGRSRIDREPSSPLPQKVLDRKTA
jgi:hypothetical protein